MLGLKRDFTRFLCMKNFPQQVVVHIGSEELICSGILLAQQSELIEKLIVENSGILNLGKIDEIGGSEQVISCIKFMYGAKLQLSLENIGPSIKFASLYGVDELFNRCCQWMEKNVSTRNMLNFFEIPSVFNSEKQSTRVKSIVEKFVSQNSDICGSELLELIANGYQVNTELFMKVIYSSPSNGSDLLTAWTSKSLENKTKILETAENIDFVKLFPVQEDFTSFVSHLSEGSDSVESMKQVLQLQQSYFMKNAMKQTENINKADIQTTQSSLLSPKSGRKCNPVSAENSFKLFDARSCVQQNNPKGQQHQHCKPANKPIQNKVNQKSNKGSHHKEDNTQQNKTLFVGNLPPNATSEDIMMPLNFAGKIKNVDLVPHKNIAFVQFQSENSLKVILDASKSGVKFTVKGQQVAVQKYFKTGKESKHGSVV